MHKENMRYKQDKDERMQELARLALLNQSTMAAAMVTMAEAVKASRNPNDHSKPGQVFSTAPTEHHKALASELSPH